jgi:hypothetical protein
MVQPRLGLLLDHDEFGLKQSKLMILDIGYIRCLRKRDRF